MTRGAQARPHVTALPDSESAMPRRSGPSCLGKSVKKISSYLIGPILRNLESPFILWIQIDIYFLASTIYSTLVPSSGTVPGSVVEVDIAVGDLGAAQPVDRKSRAGGAGIVAHVHRRGRTEHPEGVYVRFVLD